MDLTTFTIKEIPSEPGNVLACFYVNEEWKGIGKYKKDGNTLTLLKGISGEELLLRHISPPIGNLLFECDGKFFDKDLNEVFLPEGIAFTGYLFHLSLH